VSALSNLSDEEFTFRVQQRRVHRMERIDAMNQESRELVHEYGLRVVDTCQALGVSKPRHIRHLVEAVLDEFSPTRGSYSVQGVRTPTNAVEEADR
jgi:hypothetical protein